LNIIDGMCERFAVTAVALSANKILDLLSRAYIKPV
jgi:hypothetical protein